jgi:hypothetical protein
MYEYHKEQVAESEFDSRSAALAGDGWRLVSVVINPLSTAEAAPLYVTFWEKSA